ncbi:DUF4136 domain-containing protein [Rhodoferax sp. GW822-FHT02A01]|uniref:DUF4136 domain-containing protein n=1 Tax=Rhodoferax sp. GW822-FHT02A01 TaxID=3141537 RepID=UPI00315DC886
MSKSLRALIAGCAAVLALAVLSGCSTTRMIDSDVQSFTGTTAAVRPATYRFERLPSQTQSLQQDTLEAMAAKALAQVGLTQSATTSAEGRPRYSVQVSAQVLVLQNTFSYGGMGGFWARHAGFGMGAWMEPVWYRHGVHVLMRELTSGQVVYETSASFDGTWSDSGNLLPVLLQAALQDYPQPPAGPRKVNIELPGGPAQQP